MTATATVIKLPEPQPQPRAAPKMQCSACGATADAACDCGATYMPVSVRAADAIAKNPEKSNRAIAAELKVAEASVRRARASYDAPDEKRIGKDGKSYPVNKPRKSENEPPENYQAAFFLRVDLAVTAKRECEQLVGYGAMTRPMLKQAADAARAVAKAWSELALSLEQSLAIARTGATDHGNGHTAQDAKSDDNVPTAATDTLRTRRACPSG